MKQLLSGATGNTVSNPINRTQSVVLSGIFKYKKTGAGTCTLTLKDSMGAIIHSFTVTSNDPASASEEVPIPAAYKAEITSASGSFNLDAWMDGDA